MKKEITPKLPDLFNDGGPIPCAIIGPTIVAMGSYADNPESLVIDYIDANGNPKRLVLWFNERGMWVSDQI